MQALSRHPVPQELGPPHALVTADIFSPDSCPAVLVLDVDEAARWLRRAGNRCDYAVVVWSDAGKVPDALLQHSQLTGVIGPDASAATVYAALKSAHALVTQYSRGLRTAEMLERVLEIGRALASEKELDVLLGLVLSHARRLTGADGASIYTKDAEGKLYFRLWQNASTATQSGEAKVLVGEDSIAGYVARTGEVLNLEDAYRLPKDAPYTFNSASDKSLGYRTRAMLTLPLKNKAGEVVGVLQLINRKEDFETRLASAADFEQKVLPFDAASEQVALALAGQAGVALENSILYQDIERLFEGFIRASVQAIEARDPTTAGHSSRVAEFTERLGRAVDRADLHSVRAIRFSREQLRELRYAALLHDFGKVGVRENVLVKANKLYPDQLERIQHRFQFARTSMGRHAYREVLDMYEAGELGPEELAHRRRELEQRLAQEDARLQRFLNAVLTANQPSVLHEDVSSELAQIAAYSYRDHDGNESPLLHEFEFSSLALSKGSLSPAERDEIESHVSHTFDFLRLIPWTRELAQLPEIAAAHHEKLDGTGYPRGLQAHEIPVQSKMMAIADIYDALTASDRPYKKALPVARALDILAQEAKAGKVDGDLYTIFVDSRAFELISG
jgi:HD-GYP domain-containing protein (c-di-GMP phosphodiesterase class II)